MKTLVYILVLVPFFAYPQDTRVDTVIQTTGWPYYPSYKYSNYSSLCYWIQDANGRWNYTCITYAPSYYYQEH